MEHYSFVILHYLAEKDTIECIDSILENVDYANYDIIVVDNASYNDSINNIKARYQSVKKIHFIESEENLGFAKGNNLGFVYAKTKLHSDFICLINNDTIISQKDFISKTISIYNSDGFAVLGPNIIARNGVHQNPVSKKLITMDELKEDIKKYEKLVKRYERRTYKCYEVVKRISIEILRIIKIDHIIREFIRKYLIKAESQEFDYLSELENVQLHGSCLIFSPEYITKYDGLYSETFMFMEEDILFFMSQRDRFKMLYTPEIEIFHKEDVSTDYILKSNFEKRKFVYSNHILSGKKLLKLMQETSKSTASSENHNDIGINNE